MPKNLELLITPFLIIAIKYPNLNPIVGDVNIDLNTWNFFNVLSELCILPILSPYSGRLWEKSSTLLLSR